MMNFFYQDNNVLSGELLTYEVSLSRKRCVIQVKGYTRALVYRWGVDEALMSDIYAIC